MLTEFLLTETGVLHCLVTGDEGPVNIVVVVFSRGFMKTSGGPGLTSGYRGKVVESVYVATDIGYLFSVPVHICLCLSGISSATTL